MAAQRSKHWRAIAPRLARHRLQVRARAIDPAPHPRAPLTSPPPSAPPPFGPATPHPSTAPDRGTRTGTPTRPEPTEYRAISAPRTPPAGAGGGASSSLAPLSLSQTPPP